MSRTMKECAKHGAYVPGDGCPECRRERMRVASRKHYESHHDLSLERRRRWREANHERERERKRLRHLIHPEERREYDRRYYATNSDRLRAEGRDRMRSRRASLLPFVAELRGMPRVMCFSCGRGPDEVQLDLHHILQCEKEQPPITRDEAAKCIPLCHGMCHQAWHNAPRYKSITEREYPQHMWDFAHDQGIAYTQWYREQQEPEICHS